MIDKFAQCGFDGIRMVNVSIDANGKVFDNLLNRVSHGTYD